MNLRLRLIVVFFLLSVVPVGAVTYYSYSNNAQAIRDAAGVEAESLAGELTNQMRAVTAQLSQGVEDLMAMEQPVDSPTTLASAPPPEPAASPAPETSAATPVVDEERALLEQVLGDMAGLISNITIDYGRRGGRRGGGGPNGTGRGGPPPAPGPPGEPPAPPQPPGPDGGVGPNGGPVGAALSPDGRRGGINGRTGGVNGATSGRGGGRGAEPPADPNGIRIDLRQIQGELFRELVPDRAAFDALPDEDKQKVFDQIDQTMQGVRQGIEVLRTELEARAVAFAEIRTQGATEGAAAVLGNDASTSVAPGASGPAPTPATQTAAPTPPAAPVAPAPAAPSAQAQSAAAQASAAQAAAARAAAETSAADQTAAQVQRLTELSGQRLAIRLERNGEVVGEAGVDIDLSMLLATVFEMTSRDRGEVPFAVSQDGTLYTITDADKATLESLETPAVDADSAEGTTILADWIVVTTPGPAGSGLKFGIARPIGDALQELQQTSARNAGLGLGVIGLALIAIVPLSGRLTRNLDRLSEGVNRIAQGDYAARVQVSSHDEVGRLARAFNVMAADVEKHQRSAVEQERIRRELELGRQIQHDMLPRTPLRLGLTEVKGVSVPAREVGGDFFNYFPLHDGTIALLVGDVSGKGVGAALLMANIQAALRTRLSLGQDLASLAQELDVDIDRTTPGPVYATLFVGILDPVRRHLRCVNAGHNPQYILRADRRLERMESTGRPIGLYSGGGYTEQRFELSAGDVLFFYTDGCVEAENATGEMFGSERLERVLDGSAGHDADAVIVAVEAEVSRFRAGVELLDDATMMVVKVG